MLHKGIVCGIDHSETMVNMAKKLNKRYRNIDRVQIKHASILSLPYTDNYFDIVTAFETIQFWPDVIKGGIKRGE